jgi:hydroxycarboxylate dehydrogenase B
MAAVRFQSETLRQVGIQIFKALGTPDDIAHIVASALVEANLVGHDSHGVLRIPQYVERARSGNLRVGARPKVLTERQATAVVSGEWGFGQMAGRAAVDEAVRRAREYGVASVGLVRLTHLGRVGECVERAAAQGCTVVVWLGGLGHDAAAPYGGRRSALGTNPIAFGFPVENDYPVVVDFATTAVAAGKLMVARAAHKSIPEGIIIDREGRPSTDPQDYFNGGALLMFGGHKGYGLSVMAELLGQALTGSDVLGGDFEERGGRGRSGALIYAVDTGALRPAGEAAAAARRIVDRLRAEPPAPGVDRVRTPGQPEAEMRQEREASGITLAEDTWRAIVASAVALGLRPDELPKAAPG